MSLKGIDSTFTAINGVDTSKTILLYKAITVILFKWHVRFYMDFFMFMQIWYVSFFSYRYAPERIQNLWGGMYSLYSGTD